MKKKVLKVSISNIGKSTGISIQKPILYFREHWHKYWHKYSDEKEVLVSIQFFVLKKVLDF